MEEEKFLKRDRMFKTIMLIVLTVFLTFTFTTIYMSNKLNLGKSDISSLLNVSTGGDNVSKSISYIKTILEKYYLNEINEEELNEGAIKGYVAALKDPYTEYITKEEMGDYTINLMGNFVGIGIYMGANTQENTIEVLMPIKGSPAEEVGILAGDVIISVDDIEYTAEDIDISADKIKGKEGTIVKIGILRNQETKYFEITRRKVVTNPIEAEKLENNIGYIAISSFDEGCANNFKSKYEELKNQGITSLIIDLRNNGGGLVDETLQIADYIVPKGKELLITRDKEQKEKIAKAAENVTIDIPIVVLVNQNSASASEILAGALKDLDKATIVGKTTFGKGVIQQLLTLKDGSGLKVTVEEYFTPNRNKINGVGIEPDVIVEISGDEDTQLQKAKQILKGE